MGSGLGMDELKEYSARKAGHYTPLQALEKATETVNQGNVDKLIVITLTEDNQAAMHISDMLTYEAAGLLEEAKIMVMVDYE